MQERGAQDVAANSKSADVTFRLATLFPDCSISEVERVFAGKANRGNVSEWLRGTRSVPQWARDMIAAHFAAIEQDARRKREIAQKEKAPGRKAGARNLAIWRVANARAHGL